MVNTCISCGAVTADGIGLCECCQSNNIACPNCDAPLIFMCASRFHTDEQELYSLIYHCDICHLDWEAETAIPEQVVELKRKFWG